MQRLVNATANSARALRYLLASEAAFRLEAVLLVIALPASYMLAQSWGGMALLVASLLLLMLVEVLNTAIEAACDALTHKQDPNIGLAKDCGSLAVTIALVLAAGVWGAALLARLGEVSW